MSLDNFIPQLWSANILSALDKVHVFADLANRNYEGSILGGGDRVKINQIGAITVSDYTKNSTTLSYQDLEDAALWLTIDQAKYFAFGVDDVDSAQMNVNIMTEATRKAAYAMNDAVDTSIATIAASQAGVISGLGTSLAPLTITAKATASSNISVIELFSTIAQKLDEANCPVEGRWIVIPPWLVQKLTMASVFTISQTDMAAMTNGRVARALGFDIRMSNNLVKTTATTVNKVLAGGGTVPISFAEQLSKVEALRREGSFENAIRGLHLFGTKVVQPDALACATVSYAAEA
jgi:hypothetical protein